MTEKNPDSEPGSTPKSEPGGRVPPGETPPDESRMSGAGPQETHNPAKGWAKGPTVAILVLAALVVAFFVAYAVALI